jgi:hypothetical protein
VNSTQGEGKMTGDGVERAVGSKGFELLWSKVSELFQGYQDKSKFFEATQEYKKNYEARHGIIKVLGMSKPVALNSLYTTIQMFPQEIKFESLERLQERYRQQGSRGLGRFKSEQKNRKKGVEVACQHQYLSVLGHPGSGKTTFLKKLGLEALKGRYWQFSVQTREEEQKWIDRPCLPIFLELKSFNKKTEILTKLTEELSCCRFPKVEQLVESLLAQGELLILFDGLDEVPSQYKDEVITSLQNFVDTYPYNRYVISCRTAAYYSSFRRFTDFFIADFEDEQIEQFIQRWFSSEEEKTAEIAIDFWEELNQAEHIASKELAKTPLLLTFLCLVYKRSQIIPPQRSQLYEKALNILLEEWLTQKQVKRNPVYKGLHTGLEIELLAEIAHSSFKDDQIFFPRKQVIENISTFLKDKLDAPNELDGKKVIEAIEEQQGIIVERAEGIYSFSHLTLQEYLTAHYIESNRLEEELVKEHLHDSHWREVFLLVSGLMTTKADLLLQFMATEAKSLLNTPGLQSLISWTEQVTAGGNGSNKPVAVLLLFLSLSRSLSISLSCSLNSSPSLSLYRSLSRSLSLNRSLSRSFNPYLSRSLNHFLEQSRSLSRSFNRFLSLSRSLELALDLSRQCEKLKIVDTIDFKTLIKELEQLKTMAKPNQEADIANRVKKLCIDVLGLDEIAINLNEEEAEALERYLEAITLIVKCKEAAVSLSSKKWEKIEDQLLRV